MKITKKQIELLKDLRNAFLAISCLMVICLFIYFYLNLLEKTNNEFGNNIKNCDEYKTCEKYKCLADMEITYQSAQINYLRYIACKQSEGEING